MSDVSNGTVPCPACGGSGGGPFGRPGSAWDVETYVCPRCRGAGQIAIAPAVARPLAKGAAPEPVAVERPGIAHTRPPARRKKRTSSA
jgi:hypothetical protein